MGARSGGSPRTAGHPPAQCSQAGSTTWCPGLCLSFPSHPILPRFGLGTPRGFTDTRASRNPPTAAGCPPGPPHSRFVPFEIAPAGGSRGEQAASAPATLAGWFGQPCFSFPFPSLNPCLSFPSWKKRVWFHLHQPEGLSVLFPGLHA